VPLQIAGAACTADTQCSSGHCTDGFCCGVSLCPTCQSCGVPGAQGTCTNVAPGAADETGTCKNQGAATCGNDGVCDGNGACQNYGTSTVCASACALDDLTFITSFCDGAGTCVPGQAAICLNGCDDTLGGCQ